MKILLTVFMVAILCLPAAGQYIPRSIDSTVINTPGELDRVIRTTLRRLPQVQRVSTFLRRRSGVDSVTATFPEPFKDSTFSFFIAVADTYLNSSGAAPSDFVLSGRPLNEQQLMVWSWLCPIVVHDADTGVYIEVIGVLERK